MRHTPGPWVACAYTEPFNNADGERMGWHINQADGVGYITTIFRASHRAAVDEANARLIAAAPDLLEALTYVRRFVSGKDVDLVYIDAAIAKAISPPAVGLLPASPLVDEVEGDGTRPAAVSEGNACA